MKATRTLLALLTAGSCFAAQADELSVISFGGANKEAQVKAYYEPFTKATGTKVVAGEYNGEMAKLKAMVETNSVSWDVVEVESSEVARGCDEGFFEKLDYKVIGSKGELKAAPTSWADFWDVKKFPGKRGLRKTAKYALEAALLADGVAQKDVYAVLATPAGVDRAFKKLDELKPNIQWWEAGAQAPQYLISGDVVMTSSFNGRISNAQKEGNKNLSIAWNGGLYEVEYWVVPKGTPKKDLAMKFIASTVKPESQIEYAKQIPYGPTTKNAAGKIEPSLASTLPSSPENLKMAVAVDPAFWLDHGEELERRFNAWAAK